MSEQLTTEMLAELTLADMEDVPLDLIPDSASFVNPPKGLYQCTIVESGPKTIGSGDSTFQGVELVLEIAAVIELEDDTQTPPAVGSKCSTFYGEGKGIQAFKTQWGNTGKELGATTVKELWEKLEGAEITVQLSTRKYKSKAGEDKQALNIYSPALSA